MSRCTGCHTCKGFGNPLFLPLPGLVILLGGSLVILGQSAFSGAARALGVRVSAVLGWLIRRVVQGQLLHRSFLGCSSARSYFYKQGEKLVVNARVLRWNFIDGNGSVGKNNVSIWAMGIYDCRCTYKTLKQQIFAKPNLHISCLADDKCVVIFQLTWLGDNTGLYWQFQLLALLLLCG